MFRRLAMVAAVLAFVSPAHAEKWDLSTMN